MDIHKGQVVGGLHEGVVAEVLLELPEGVEGVVLKSSAGGHTSVSIRAWFTKDWTASKPAVVGGRKVLGAVVVGGVVHEGVDTGGVVRDGLHWGVVADQPG